MNFLEERILRDGIIKPGNVLKVDSFLNHQLDVALLEEIGAEFHRRFADVKVTKVLTIETSGIAMAYPVAKAFGVPLVFAKKSQSVNLDGEMYVAEVDSFTHKRKNLVIVSKKYIQPSDRVLIIDDFLANGAAINGLMQIVEEAGAELVGAGICIEKGWQPGGDHLRGKGIKLVSLAVCDHIENGKVICRD